MQTEVAHIHVNMLRDVAGQALDFNRTHDDFENAAVHFHTARFTAGMDRQIGRAHV